MAVNAQLAEERTEGIDDKLTREILRRASKEQGGGRKGVGGVVLE